MQAGTPPDPNRADFVGPYIDPKITHTLADGPLSQVITGDVTTGKSSIRTTGDVREVYASDKLKTVDLPASFDNSEAVLPATVDAKAGWTGSLDSLNIFRAATPYANQGIAASQPSRQYLEGSNS